MALTHKYINSLKPSKECTAKRPDKYSHGNGLQLLVRHTGTKTWISSYRYAGKQQSINLGQYPTVSLQNAIKENIAIKEDLAKGINPKLNRKKSKAKHTFDDVAQQWFTNVHSKKTIETTYKRDYSQYKRDIQPFIGQYPLDELTPPQILEIAHNIEKRGATDMSKRALGKVSEIYRYAKELGYTNINPADGLTRSSSLAKHIVKHHPTIDKQRLPKLLQDVSNYTGHLLVIKGLWFMAYTFLRTKNIRLLEWSEIDFDNQMLSIVSGKMKARKHHKAPLSNQAIQILLDIKEMGLNDKYVFFNIIKKQPYSCNAFSNALNNMGYGGEMTGHGFRILASTVLNDYGFNKDVVESELSHSDKDNVRSTYNHADYMNMRAEMVQKWADYLDSAYQGKMIDIAPSKIGNSNPKDLIKELLEIYSKQQLIDIINDME